MFIDTPKSAKFSLLLVVGSIIKSPYHDVLQVRINTTLGQITGLFSIDINLDELRFNADQHSVGHLAIGQIIYLGEQERGYAYLQGEGVPRDYVQAYKWYSIAAARFEALGSKHHGQAVGRLQEVADKLTTAERAAAEEAAKNWKPAAPQ